MRCGCSRCASHKRCTARRLTPTALAMARPVQCVAWPGGSEQVRSITLAMILAENGARPGLRVLSRNRPSTPCSAYRACQRQTEGRLTPARRATSCAGQQTLTIFGGRKEADGLSHAHRLAHAVEPVNHPSVSLH